MRHEEAVDLIRGGVPPGGAWADLGAGEGTFTRALAELLGPEGTIYAVDREARAVRALRRLDLPESTTLEARRADFTEALDLPELDGVLMANALHFVAEPATTLERVAGRLRPGGRLLLVEYERRTGNRWVPHPVPLGRFRRLATAVGLEAPREVGRRPSAYHREMYAAVARTPEEGI